MADQEKVDDKSLEPGEIGANGEVGDWEDIPDEEKVPVSIITGYLGAGKTTLVNHILRENHGRKICVIINEFGAESVDDKLVYETIETKEDIKIMDNGCVCCTVRDDLESAFTDLIELEAEYDSVLIETTGIADPAPILFTLKRNPDLDLFFRVDGVITMVDAKHIGLHLAEQRADDEVNEAVQQVAFADKIIINKTDLVTPEELSQLKKTIKSINGFAPILESQRSVVPMNELLNIQAFNLERTVELDPTLLDSDDEDSHKCGENCTHEHHKHEQNGHSEHKHEHEEHKHEEHKHEHEHEHDEHKHEHKHEHEEHKHEHEHKREEANSKPTADGPLESPKGSVASSQRQRLDAIKKRKAESGGETDYERLKKKRKADGLAHSSKKKKHNLSHVGSVVITIDGPLDFQKFSNFMESYLNEFGIDVYRSKGVLAFADKGRQKHAFQAVHEQVTFDAVSTQWTESEQVQNKLVFIGKDIDQEYLEKQLQACVADATTVTESAHQ